LPGAAFLLAALLAAGCLLMIVRARGLMLAATAGG